jgi:hypothetical protein
MRDRRSRLSRALEPGYGIAILAEQTRSFAAALMC